MIDLLTYPPTLAALVIGLIAAVPTAARWLRVAQRDHYVPGGVTRMAWLWVTREPATAVLLVIALAFTAVAVPSGVPPLGPYWAIVAIVALAFTPLGLPVRGRSAKFAFTVRMKRLTVAWITLHVAAVIILVALFAEAAAIAPALVLLASAPLTDLALAIMAPIEKALSKKYVVQAQKRLQQVKPRIVAITGSYGKTSTKNYVAHLVSATYPTVASPASFNNRLGLSRAVNDKLVPGTEIFVAEMGMAGEGQIRELCQAFPPDIAAITVIGEAHLERMRTTDAIFREKAQITENAKTVVIPIDDPRLAAHADACVAQGKTVVTVSTAGADADVVLDAVAGTIRIGRATQPVPVSVSGTGHAVNVAVAAGIALASGVPVDTIAGRLGELPGSAHRAEVQTAPSGARIIDDTYNSNPVGAHRALEGAAALAAESGGPLVVVTPGMVELGPVQAERNRAFGEAIKQVGGVLYAVGRTNRAALVRGFGAGAETVARREQAVAAAVAKAGDRGVILYENDLPDHYP